MTNHIPKGFSAVTPYLLLADPVGFIEFAQKALGATKRMAQFDDDGRLVHAEIEVEGCPIEMGQPQGDFEPTRTALHVFVEDPDAVWKKAVEQGRATSIRSTLSDDLADLLAVCTKLYKRHNKRINGNRFVPVFHLRYVRLARVEAICEFLLSHATILTQLSQAVGKSESQLNDQFVGFIKVEKL